MKSGERLACRCDCALYRHGSSEESAVAVLRFAPKKTAASQFLVLSERIEQLTRENKARRRAEEALAQASTRYRVTLESIGDAVIATDAAGAVTFMNAVAQRLTGWSFKEAEGRHLDEVFVILNEHTLQPVESPVAKVLTHGTTVGLANHTVLTRRDGSQLPIDDSAAPIWAGGGRMDGVVLVFRDLTERHALERELREKNAVLEEADRRKNLYLSMLAHELRNPLAPLRNGLEIMRRQEVPSSVARIVDIMARQIQHLVRLVDDLLDVARVTTGKVELRSSRLSAAELMRTAEEVGRPICEDRGIQLQVNLPAPDVSVQGDLTRLTQVLGNLIANASKFSQAGGKVIVEAEVEGADLAISVTDEGIGIAPDDLQRIFDLFYQAEQGIGRERGGLGVGLTIAHGLVQMHGGAVRVFSKGIGQGSRFIVTLPLCEK